MTNYIYSRNYKADGSLQSEQSFGTLAEAIAQANSDGVNSMYERYIEIYDDSEDGGRYVVWYDEDLRKIDNILMPEFESDEALYTRCERAAAYIKLNTHISHNVSRRRETAERIFDALRIRYEFLGEKPHTGAAFRLKAAKDGYRLNIRCGYCRHNYAPVYFLKNETI